MNKNETCYMCNAVATTTEHVPPKCLFPKSKDIGGENYRLNLITVPSCEEHNCDKSNDDEFLMVSLAGIIGNNSIGYHHYQGKINRALRRSSYRLLDEAFIRKKLQTIEADNKFMEFIWGTPDYHRLIKCFDHIAKGLYRHHFGEKFNGETKAHLGFIFYSDKNGEEFKRFLKHRAEIDLRGKEKFGHNKKVFYYQFADPDQFGIFMVKMCFYENVDIFVAFIPETSEKPCHLGVEMISQGIRTTFDVEGTKYEFNKS